MRIIPKNEKELSRETKFCDLYVKWFRNRTEEEKKLFESILKYEGKYFGDFHFRSNSIVAPFLKYREEVDGKMKKVYAEIPVMTTITDMFYRVRVRNLDKNTYGRCEHKKRIITITPSNLNNKPLILHEMIHAYVDGLNYCFREILLTCLYRDLSRKTPKLDSYLTKKNHVFEAKRIANAGGFHSILFNLKSLDLDFRCGFKPGTVFGYAK
jgi:hypothetical protein